MAQKAEYDQPEIPGGGRFFWRRSGPVEYATEPFEMQVPANGYAFDFGVVVRCVLFDFSRPGGAASRRRAEYEWVLRDIVMEKARSILGRCEPDQAAEAEEVLNQALESLARDQSEPRLRWTAQAEVTSPPEVRKLQREEWLRRNEIAGLREYSSKMIRTYRDTINEWREFLAALGIGGMNEERPAPFIAPHLVRLAAEPGSAAAVIQELAKNREEKDKDLLRKVAEAIGQVENLDVNLFEYEIAQESALRRLMEWAGLPVPNGSAGWDGGQR